MDLEITKMLTVGAFLITSADYERLVNRASGDEDVSDYLCHGDPNTGIVEVLVEKLAYGGEDTSLHGDGFSDQFNRLVTLAQENDCTWIRVHPDGPEIEGFEVLQ